jgi:hypothetical protein
VIGSADAGNTGPDDDDIEMFGLCDRMWRSFVQSPFLPSPDYLSVNFDGSF